MAKVKVRYLRGGRIQEMADYYARTLVNLGLVEVIVPESQEEPPKKKNRGRPRKYKTRMMEAESYDVTNYDESPTEEREE